MKANFFTRSSPRYELPHGRIEPRQILIVHQAISRAFEFMRTAKFPLSSSLEDDITIKLEEVLNNQVLNRGEIEGFNKDFFGKTRRIIVVNYNGIKKSKKPDLCFELQRENHIEWDQVQDALFAECKPVDKKHLLKDHYCEIEKDCTGVERFIIGDYAWAMQEALMIGYARDGFVMATHLPAALQEDAKKEKLGTPSSLIIIERPSDTSQGLAKTTHQRRFTWQNGKAATSIDIFHSWHDCG